jgi:hypothetical protein
MPGLGEFLIWMVVFVAVCRFVYRLIKPKNKRLPKGDEKRIELPKASARLGARPSVDE